MFENYKFGFLVFFLLAALGVWSYFGTIDIVTATQGVVAPSAKIKKIQHLEGGIIHSIQVREGERVAEGDALVELEGATSEAELNELQARLTTLKIDLIRLTAELENKAEFQFSDELLENHSEKIKKSIEFFTLRKNSLENRVSVQKKMLGQKVQEMKEILQRIEKNKKYKIILKEKINISAELMKDALSNRLQHLSYLEQEIGIDGKIAEDFWAVKQSQTAIEEAKLRISGLKDIYRTEILTDYNEKISVYSELKFRRKKFEDNRSRKVIRSPVSGRIKYLYFSTVGGVVAPGAVVLEIVPEAGKLIIEARLPVNEKAYVRVGQSVKIRLAASGPAGLGQIVGNVAYISADSIAEARQPPYFLVRIFVDEKSISYKGKDYELVSGESVVCNILTGKRRVLDYFLEPFWSIENLALRER
jgi:adhesin transport system membrane fusion protein